MRILLSSYSYSPNFGGIESVSEILAREWAHLGCEVRVITEAPEGESIAPSSVPIIRSPRTRELLAQMRWCDVFFQNNLSLRLARMWPLCPKPWFVTHQTWLTHPGHSSSLSLKLKHLSLRCSRSIAISHAISDQLPGSSIFIPNPYDQNTFLAPTTDTSPTRDIAFVGRLVSDKGADLLIASLAQITARNSRPVTATIIGAGPEETALRTAVADAGLQSQVAFSGRLSPAEVARTLRDHRVLAVPSRWP